MANIAAAPVPWSARKAFSTVASSDRPQQSEAAVKTTNPIVKMRRRPSRSPNEPKTSRKEARVSAYASTTHWRLERLASRLFWIDGSATLTIVTSRRSMNVATQTAISVHHLRSIAYLLCLGSPP